jgi:predicted lipoprotein with Yx(FWY)xxD motif
MTIRKVLGASNGDRVKRVHSSPARIRLLKALSVAAAAAGMAAVSSAAAAPAPSSAVSSVHAVAPVNASTPTQLKTAKIGGVTVLTNAKGFTLYWFAPDTSTMSKCNSVCAQIWPPVKGPATASGVKGTFGTIKRSDGSVQATFKGHPLYTFTGDAAPGTAKGNGLNVNGGVWHEVTTSGAAKHSSMPGSGGGYGY